MKNLPFTIYHLPFSRSVKEQGQTLFELIMAIGVGVIIITAITTLTTLSINNSSFAKNDAGALRYAQEGLEWVRTERDKSWTTVASKSGLVSQNYCISTLNWTSSGQCSSSQVISGTVFKRDLSLTSHDYDGDSQIETIETVVVISWTDGGKTHSTNLTTQLTGWKVQ